MKRLKCLILASVLAVTCCACSDSELADYEELYNVERVEYEADPSYIKLYEGNLYAAEFSEASEQIISVFDETGEKIREFTLKDAYIGSGWDIADGKSYSVCDTGDYSEETGEYTSRMTLYSSDIETGESEEICDFEGLKYIFKIKAVGNRLYWLGQKKDAEIFQENLNTDNNGLINCYDPGNVFGYVDLSTGEITETDISHPMKFSERNGRIILYAYEENKGYCFYDYTAENTVCRTNKLGMITDFEIINDNMDYVFLQNGEQSPYRETLSFSGMDDESGIIQLDDGFSPVRFSAEGDYLCVQAMENMYVLSGESKVYKYPINFSTADPPIRVITASDLSKNTPLFSCGYQLKTDLLSPDGFSLTVLSLDKNYDMAMLSSSERYAAEVKDKGSFYPLNDVPGVKEYIDSCFPYIKDAATDENGDIWMLPVSVDVPAVVYNEKNCAEKGIAFSSDFGSFIEEIQNAGDSSAYCFCERYFIMQSMLNSYFTKNNTFDTEEFRAFADTFVKNYDNKSFKNNKTKITSAFKNHMQLEKYGRGLPDSDKYEEIYEKALYAVTGYLSTQRDFLGDENLRAAPVPSFYGTSNAFCTFICVNPNSEHLSETLLFIQRTVSRFKDKQNGFTLQDKSAYDDDPYTAALYEVYKNSEISFNVSLEIYQDDFEKCAMGLLGIDEFITEADRKLSAYLNE